MYTDLNTYDKMVALRILFQLSEYKRAEENFVKSLNELGAEIPTKKLVEILNGEEIYQRFGDLNEHLAWENSLIDKRLFRIYTEELVNLINSFKLDTDERTRKCFVMMVFFGIMRGITERRVEYESRKNPPRISIYDLNETQAFAKYKELKPHIKAKVIPAHLLYGKMAEKWKPIKLVNDLGLSINWEIIRKPTDRGNYFRNINLYVNYLEAKNKGTKPNYAEIDNIELESIDDIIKDMKKKYGFLELSSHQ